MFPCSGWETTPGCPVVPKCHFKSWVFGPFAQSFYTLSAIRGGKEPPVFFSYWSDLDQNSKTFHLSCNLPELEWELRCRLVVYHPVCFHIRPFVRYLRSRQTDRSIWLIRIIHQNHLTQQTVWGVVVVRLFELFVQTMFPGVDKQRGEQGQEAAGKHWSPIGNQWDNQWEIISIVIKWNIFNPPRNKCKLILCDHRNTFNFGFLGISHFKPMDLLIPQIRDYWC